jgi:hypothetical protein
MARRLAGKIAVVTGDGFAIAKRFAKARRGQRCVGYFVEQSGNGLIPWFAP